MKRALACVVGVPIAAVAFVFWGLSRLVELMDRAETGA